MPGFAACSGKRLGATVTVALLLASAPVEALDTTQRLQLLAREDLRVATVFARLTTAATPDCAEHQLQPGLVVHAIGQYAPAARPAAAALFGLDDRPAVLAVVADGVAARAGIAARDVLVAIDGTAATPSIASQLSRALGKGSATFTIERSGARSDVRLFGAPACRGRIELVPDPARDARANDGRITVTTGLVEEVPDDDGLAFLIAHELAHVALGHRERGRNAEAAADALGLRIAARAGYDPRAAAPTLEVLAAARGQRWRIDLSHPTLSGRLATLHALAAQLRPSSSP